MISFINVSNDIFVLKLMIILYISVTCGEYYCFIRGSSWSWLYGSDSWIYN